MKLDKLYNEKFVISFEIFPPKTPLGAENLCHELQLLSVQKPDFVSVTYGAGGSTRNQTLEIALQIRNDYNITPLVHFTCVGASKNNIRAYLEEVKSNGIDNILALRGDPPAGETSFTARADGFAHADELIAFIRGIDHFTIAAAGYPEVHTEALSKKDDLLNLKKKTDAGADFIITQLFYDNNAFYDYINNITKLGINVPIVPGIMPITSRGQISRLIQLSGTKIPPALMAALEKCDTPEAETETGLEFSIKQCDELKSWGVKGLHIYTMNKSNTVLRIMNELGCNNHSGK